MYAEVLARTLAAKPTAENIAVAASVITRAQVHTSPSARWRITRRRVISFLYPESRLSHTWPRGHCVRAGFGTGGVEKTLTSPPYLSSPLPFTLSRPTPRGMGLKSIFPVSFIVRLTDTRKVGFALLSYPPLHRLSSLQFALVVEGRVDDPPFCSHGVPPAGRQGSSGRGLSIGAATRRHPKENLGGATWWCTRLPH